MKRQLLACAALLALVQPTFAQTSAAPSAAAASAQSAMTPEVAKEIAAETYIYAYPLVLMDVTRRQVTNVPQPAFPLSPLNTIAHARAFPGPEMRVVVRPNFDTLYSSGYIDLGAEPIVLSLPATERYFMFPLLSTWTDVFDVPGTRTTGPNQAVNILLVSPRWQGQAPAGMTAVRAPTRYVSFIGRTKTNGPADYDTVHRIQDGMHLTPLSAWGHGDWHPAPAKVDPSVDMKTPPPETLAAMDPATFLRRFTEALQDSPPGNQDYPIWHRMNRIGLHVGQVFDLNSATPALRQAIEAGFTEGKQRLKHEYDRLDGVGQKGWVYTKDGGSYGVNYLLRAGVAAWGLGMNRPQDAIYPSLSTDSEGRPLDGAHHYVLHFGPGKLPPVNGFWSVTAYDKEGYFIRNAIHRQAIGDRSGLKTGPDGSTDIYVQADSPGPEREANWLPVQPGSFNLMLRLYAPKESFLNGEWAPPPLMRTN